MCSCEELLHTIQDLISLREDISVEAKKSPAKLKPFFEALGYAVESICQVVVEENDRSNGGVKSSHNDKWILSSLKRLNYKYLEMDQCCSRDELIAYMTGLFHSIELIAHLGSPENQLTTDSVNEKDLGYEQVKRQLGGCKMDIADMKYPQARQVAAQLQVLIDLVDGLALQCHCTKRYCGFGRYRKRQWKMRRLRLIFRCGKRRRTKT